MKINLATRVYLDTRKIRLFAAGLLTASLLFAGWNLREVVVIHQEIGSLRGIISRQTLSTGARTISEADYQRSVSAVTSVNSFLVRRSTDWLQLMDSLERVLPDGVMLTELSSDGSKGNVYRIGGYATDFQKVRRLFERMSEGDLFTDVFLVSQSRLKVSESQQGVSFAMTARLRK